MYIYAGLYCPVDFYTAVYISCKLFPRCIIILAFGHITKQLSIRRLPTTPHHTFVDRETLATGHRIYIMQQRHLNASGCCTVLSSTVCYDDVLSTGLRNAFCRIVSRHVSKAFVHQKKTKKTDRHCMYGAV